MVARRQRRQGRACLPGAGRRAVTPASAGPTRDDAPASGDGDGLLLAERGHQRRLREDGVLQRTARAQPRFSKGVGCMGREVASRSMFGTAEATRARSSPYPLLTSWNYGVRQPPAQRRAAAARREPHMDEFGMAAGVLSLLYQTHVIQTVEIGSWRIGVAFPCKKESLPLSVVVPWVSAARPPPGALSSTLTSRARPPPELSRSGSAARRPRRAGEAIPGLHPFLTFLASKTRPVVRPPRCLAGRRATRSRRA
jgi:hypothetical protein